MESANKMNAGSESNCVHEQVAKRIANIRLTIPFTDNYGMCIKTKLQTCSISRIIENYLDRSGEKNNNVITLIK